MNLRVPKVLGKFFSSSATGGFSRRPQLHGVSYEVFTEMNVAIEVLQDIKMCSLADINVSD
jgi:hypothetical protein